MKARALVIFAPSLMMGALLAATAFEPRELVFDEVHYVQAAREILGKGFYDMHTHPPLGKELIAAGMWLAGDKAVGWRVFSVMFGVASVALLALAVYLGTGSVLAGFIASLGLALDPLHFTQSRVAMLDIFQTPLLLGALTVVLKRRSLLGFSLAGVLAGLAAACKLPAAVVGLSLGLYFSSGGKAWRMRLLKLLCYGASAIAAYILTYLPYFACGHGLVEWLKDTQLFMLYVGTTFKFEHPYMSPACTWLIGWKPVLYYYKVDQGSNYVHAILALGNVASWLPSFAILLKQLAYPRGEMDLLPSVWFAPCYVSLMLVRRPTFIFYMEPLIPALYMSVGVEVGYLAGEERILAAVAAVMLYLASALFLLPLSMGILVPVSYLREMLIVGRALWGG